jgi:ribonuclease HII
MKVIAGCDEVGRGCFAGPLVAGAVILDINLTTNYKDSKKLTSPQREKISQEILNLSRCGIGLVSVEEIDVLGLTLANQLAIIRAVKNLKTSVDIVLIDGNLKFSDKNYFSIIKGDSFVQSISAASIIAKVYRDNLMQQLHKTFPIYNWMQNKGYGTLEHRTAISNYGATLHHRRSFL